MAELNRQLGAEDQFGNLISFNTNNRLDIASHYPYSPERWRIFVDGSRKFPEYNSVSQYNHATDVHEITPNSSETVTFETAERARYVVQYTGRASFAFSVNQSLQSADTLRVGYFDDNNGWFMEHGSNHNDDQVDLVVRRGGSTKKRKQVTLSKPITEFQRYQLDFNWYNVGGEVWLQTYTENNQQKNDVVGRIAIDDGTRGPKQANQHLRYEISAGSGTSNLKLNAGSVAYAILGDANAINRQKTASIQTSGTSIDSTGEWLPIAAIKRSSTFKIVNMSFSQLKINEFDGAGDVRVVAIACDSSNTDASGFSTPEEHSGKGSAIQQTTSVTTAPNSQGTSTTTIDNPGGYQVAYASFYSDSTGSVKAKEVSGIRQKRGIYQDDIVVLLAKATATGDVKMEHTTQQNW